MYRGLLKNFNNRAYFFIAAVIMLLSLFFINSWIIDKLRTDLKSQVMNVANSYKSMVQKILIDSLDNPNSKGMEDIVFFQNHFVKAVDFPILFESDGEFFMSQPEELKNREDIALIAGNMADNFTPIKIEVSDDTGKVVFRYKLYYGDPQFISLIKLIPFIEVAVILFFVFIAGLVYYISKRNTENALYVGISKETAHQLGTPISSLLGWVERMKEGQIDRLAVSHIEQDVYRLKEISERFSKIGSKIRLGQINGSNLLDEIIMYTNKRIPRTKDIKILANYKSNIKIKGDRMLLSWAFENLIKNSIEAIKISNGRIEVNAKLLADKCIIDFIDTGIGISIIDKDRIFSPGYSTKIRGWGVGLSLSRRIIEEIHLGKIFVLSSIPGETKIRVIL